MQVGRWINGFSRLESLFLCTQDFGLTVSASLAGLTRLTELALIARTREHSQFQSAAVGAGCI